MTPSARPRLLLIHGLLGSLNYFEPQRYLPGVDVLGPDLIGYGQRRSEDGGITLHAQAALLARYLRDEAGGPAWVLGHSVGGAVAMLLADMVPELVRGLISVEGNFTLKDAFWTGRIAALPDADWAAEYGAMEAAPAAWLEKSGIEASDERIVWARDILANQPYTTVQKMAQSVLDTTGAPDYLGCVGRVLARVPRLRLRELAEEDRLMLLRLTEQVAQIAERIDRLSPDAPSSGLEEPDPMSAFRFEARKRDFANEVDNDGERLARAVRPPLPDPRLLRRIIRQRQLRARFFDGDLFAGQPRRRRAGIGLFAVATREGGGGSPCCWASARATGVSLVGAYGRAPASSSWSITPSA